MKTQTLQPHDILDQDWEISFKDSGHPPATADELVVAELRAYLGDLPEIHRHAFVLRRFDRFEYDEIAAKLQISERAARQIVYDVLRELRVLFASGRGAS